MPEPPEERSACPCLLLTKCRVCSYRPGAYAPCTCLGGLMRCEWPGHFDTNDAPPQPAPSERRRHVVNESGICVQCGGTSKDWRGPTCDVVQPAPRKCEHPKDCHDGEGYHVCGSAKPGERTVTCPDQAVQPAPEVYAEQKQCVHGWFACPRCEHAVQPAPDRFKEALMYYGQASQEFRMGRITMARLKEKADQVRAAHAAAVSAARTEGIAIETRRMAGVLPAALAESRAAGKREMAEAALAEHMERCDDCGDLDAERCDYGEWLASRAEKE